MDSCMIYACVSGDVGTGHILSSKRLKQDEIEVLDINGECTSNSFSPSPNGTISTFLTLSSTLQWLAICFAKLHTASFINHIVVVLQTLSWVKGSEIILRKFVRYLSWICLIFRCELLPESWKPLPRAAGSYELSSLHVLISGNSASWK